MIIKKRLLSVAAAVAISSTIVGADYLPLTSNASEDKWVMFGVTGFHANGAAVAAGGTEAGMFTVSDDTDNVAEDTGGDELYGEEGATPTGSAILDGANILASVKRVDGTASEVEVRVDVSNINYYESDPVRTIYVKQDADAATPLFAFSFKSALEGERLEFTTTSSGTTDDAYFITINSENTYNNPAIGTYIPAVDPSDADNGVYLTGIQDVVDYDFVDGPQEPNPLKSSKYLQIDHQDVADTDEDLRIYGYDPLGTWELYDSRNNFQDFEALEKGKGYWGKMNLAAATPAGLVLGDPSITTQDYIDSGIAEGWNLLAFNADNADLRAATTGMIVPLAAAGDIILTDVSGNHEVPITLADAVSQNAARTINQAVKVAKINGLIPKTFNIVAIPTDTNEIALLSDEKFTLVETTDAVVTGTITTLTGDTVYDAVTLEDHAAGAGAYVAASPAMSKYGEYALVVKPENGAYAQFDIKCDTLATELIAPTTTTLTTTATEVAAATCIDAAYAIDADLDATDDFVLMAATEPFEIRDHTFTRVFDYAQAVGDGELTFVNADAGVLTATITGGALEVITLTIPNTVLIDDTTDDTTFAFDGTTIGLDDADALANVIGHIAGGTYANWTVTDSDAGAGTVEFTANAMGPIGTVIGDFTFTPGTDADTDFNGVLVTDTTGVAVPATAAAIITQLNGSFGLVDTENIVANGEQIIFRMKEASTNEFRVLETGVADMFTPSTTNSTLAHGAISDVFSPNYFVKAALTNSVSVALTNVTPTLASTVTVVITTPLVAAITLDNYVVVAEDVADSSVFYTNLAAHINEQLDENAVDTTVSITDSGTAADFSATALFTGSDTTASVMTFSAGPVPTATITLATPTIGNGDLTQDLKFNFILSPNYVLDGPLYEMKEAGFTAKAMVTGTMNLAGSTMAWDGIDLTRKPSEWLDSQDYNLFTVDNAAGYWTFLEAAEANPLSFDAASFSANYTQHFDHDGATFNQVGGGLEVSVYGISDYDDRKSARVVAIVGGSEVELSRDGTSDVYTGQISSYELKEMAAGKEYDVQILVADGLGYRIPATSTGIVVDFKEPAVPAVAFNGGTIAVTNDPEDGVTKYYLFSGEIPAQSTEAAKIATILPADAAAYNLCGSSTGFSREGSYDLKFVALDGDTLATSNASDVYAIDGYAPLFKGSAIITNTMDTTPTTSLADVYYDSSCSASAVAFDQGVQASSQTNLKTVKVSYAPKTVGTGTPITVYVDGGTVSSNVASITYNEDYAGDVVFVQLGTSVFRYTLPVRATAEATTDSAPADMNTLGSYLEGQSLGE